MNFIIETRPTGSGWQWRVLDGESKIVLRTSRGAYFGSEKHAVETAQQYIKQRIAEDDLVCEWRHHGTHGSST